MSPHLRNLLEDAADDGGRPVQFDLGAVQAAGRRAVWRRRVLTGGGGVAAAAVITGVAMLLSPGIPLGDRRRRRPHAEALRLRDRDRGGARRDARPRTAGRRARGEGLPGRGQRVRHGGRRQRKQRRGFQRGERHRDAVQSRGPEGRRARHGGRSLSSRTRPCSTRWSRPAIPTVRSAMSRPAPRTRCPCSATSPGRTAHGFATTRTAAARDYQAATGADSFGQALGVTYVRADGSGISVGGQHRAVRPIDRRPRRRRPHRAADDPARAHRGGRAARRPATPTTHRPAAGFGPVRRRCAGRRRVRRRPRRNDQHRRAGRGARRSRDRRDDGSHRAEPGGELWRDGPAQRALRARDVPPDRRRGSHGLSRDRLLRRPGHGRAAHARCRDRRRAQPRTGARWSPTEPSATRGIGRRPVRTVRRPHSIGSEETMVVRPRGARCVGDRRDPDSRRRHRDLGVGEPGAAGHDLARARTRSRSCRSTGRPSSGSCKDWPPASRSPKRRRSSRPPRTEQWRA